MHTEILSWPRSQCVFADIAAEGANLRGDFGDNASRKLGTAAF